MDILVTGSVLAVLWVWLFACLAIAMRLYLGRVVLDDLIGAVAVAAFVVAGVWIAAGLG